ncbi:MAG: hypothetical protein LRY62_01345 [Alphaproteobacteria bacterium]|nr:hypothetical protein [Alphaproteobacteria bacterium]
MADFKQLPAGYKGVNLNDPAYADQRDELLQQVFDNLRDPGNYQGVYGNSESFEDWKRRLDIADPKAVDEAAVRIYAVMGPDGKVAGFSYAEIYPNGSALISYTCGKVDAQHQDYDNVIAATKRGIAQTLQDSGLVTGGLFQEHMLGANKAKHEIKGMVGEEIGQVPLAIDGIPFSYKIPIYGGDVYSLMDNQSETDTAEQIADKVKAAKGSGVYEKAAADATPATLLMADPAKTGTNPNAQIADVLESYINDYAAKNSVFKDEPTQDPGYQSVKTLVDQIREKYPNGLTVQQAYDQSLAASQKLGLNNPASVIREAFNEKVNNPLQTEAQAIMGHTAEKWEMKDKAVELLYHGDGKPETLKQGLTLMMAAADDGPEGLRGNFQAMRDLARFYYEGGINGKSFKDLGIDDVIKQDTFHAYQLAQAAKLTYPEKFNDVSGAGLDASARAHVTLMNDMAQDKKLNPFIPALQESGPGMATGQ